MSKTPQILYGKSTMEKVSGNGILVTIDVRSLYTNIPNKEGIEAMKQP